MSRVCEACGRTAADGEGPWEADVRPDGSIGVVCPACLERMTREAEDEGRLWAALEAMPRCAGIDFRQLLSEWRPGPGRLTGSPTT